MDHNLPSALQFVLDWLPSRQQIRREPYEKKQNGTQPREKLRALTHTD